MDKDSRRTRHLLHRRRNQPSVSVSQAATNYDMHNPVIYVIGGNPINIHGEYITRFLPVAHTLNTLLSCTI